MRSKSSTALQCRVSAKLHSIISKSIRSTYGSRGAFSKALQCSSGPRSKSTHLPGTPLDALRDQRSGTRGQIDSASSLVFKHLEFAPYNAFKCGARVFGSCGLLEVSTTLTNYPRLDGISSYFIFFTC